MTVRTIRFVLLAGLVATTAALVSLVGCATQAERSGAMVDARAESPEPGVVAALAPGEELWVIERTPDEAGRTPPRRNPELSRIPLAEGLFRIDADDGEMPPSGALFARCMERPDDREDYVPSPLEHTDVQAEVLGSVASVTVRQRFANPFDAKIEAVYVFPLPQDAAVHDFLMTIGSRRIRGVVREREEAERIYAAARARGHAASLLTQERPNVFTERVANIEPGHAIDVEVRYFGAVPCLDGWYEFRFPMVVGPRFNPPGTAQPMMAVDRSTPVAPLPPGAVPYLAEHERSGHDIDLALDVDAGLDVVDLRCTTHRVELTRQAATRFSATLASSDRIPNRDFVLTWKLGRERSQATLATQRTDDDGGHFLLTIEPPGALADLERRPIELVFLLDCSGSMSGAPLDIARRAMHRALERLDDRDAFQVLRFSDTRSAFAAEPMPVNDRNRRRAARFVDDLQADGGTHVVPGLRAAYDQPRDRSRERFVVLLTDGFVSNEAAVFALIREREDDARIFTMGIGGSVNEHLLAQAAELGRGAMATIGLGDGAEEAMDRFIDRVSHPVLVDVRVDWGDLDVRDLAPATLPDVVFGRPVRIAGRYEGEPRGPIVVHGRAGGSRIAIPVEIHRAASAAEPRTLARLWARRRIADLMARGGDAEEPVRRLALRYGLASPWTAFLAVDASEATGGGAGYTVGVPVPVPAGVRYDTTVPSGAGRRADAEARRPGDDG